MSKPLSNRSKSDKSKSTPLVPDVIPGRLNESEWSCLIEQDDAEDAVFGIIHDLMEATMKAVFIRYIEKQTIPFTVHQAGMALQQMIELEFISHDIGEPDIEHNPEWQEDIVPDSCRIDSWAQGAISKRCAIASLDGESGKGLTPPKQPSDDRLANNKVNCGTEQPKQNPTQNVKKSTKGLKTKSKSDTKDKTTIQRRSTPIEKRTHIPGWSERGASFKFKPYPGKLGAAGIDRIHESLDVAEQQANRIAEEGRRQRNTNVVPKVKKERFTAGVGRFVYDDEGNLVSVPKLVPSVQLATMTGTRTTAVPNLRAASPGQVVNLHYKVMPQCLNDANLLLSNTGLEWTQGKSAAKPLRQPDSYELCRNQKAKAMSSGFANVGDIIELVPGVTVSDGERVRMGPVHTESSPTQQEMRLEQLKELPCMDRDPQFTPVNTPPLAPEQIVQMSAIRLVNRE